MHKLAQNHTSEVLDMLSARVTFERTGVKLYDAVIEKIEDGGDARYQPLLGTLQKHRNEEKEHEEWLEQQIRSLGGDPHVKTEMARLEEEESQGIQSVILDGHTEVPHLIHALLTAELADNAGWDLLVKLADDAGDREAKKEFTKRMAHEVKHLAYLREVMKRSAQNEILRKDRSMPESASTAMLAPLAKPLAISAFATIGMLSLSAAGAYLALRNGRGARLADIARKGGRAAIAARR